MNYCHICLSSDHSLSELPRILGATTTDIMALGVTNLGFIEQTSMLSVIPLSSKKMSCRKSGAAATLVFSISDNSSPRGNRLLVASPFTLAIRASPQANVRAGIAEKSSCILEGQGYVRARSISRTRKGLAAAAGSKAGLPADAEAVIDSETVADPEAETDSEIVTDSETVADSEAGTDAENRQAPDESEEEATEVLLSGDSTEVQEIGDSLYSVRTLQKLVFKIGDGSKQFVMNSVGGVIGIFRKDKKKKPPEILAFETSNFESKDGKTALYQWTATELTMQHNQLVRIATDLNYLVFAFAFFGWVRVLEAILAAFATQPAKLRRLAQATNAMDPLTVAWLAYNLRKPILGILQVEPTDFQQLATLKGKLWEELHAFFERQWKVVCNPHSSHSISVIAFDLLCFGPSN